MIENKVFHDFSVVQIGKGSSKEIRQLAGVGTLISFDAQVVKCS